MCFLWWDYDRVHHYLFMRNMRNHVPSHTVGMQRMRFPCNDEHWKKTWKWVLFIDEEKLNALMAQMDLLVIIKRLIKRNKGEKITIHGNGVIIWNRIQRKSKFTINHWKKKINNKKYFNSIGDQINNNKENNKKIIIESKFVFQHYANYRDKIR